jgi:hypothetical protein
MGHKKHGRRKPYTTKGIERIPCFRCGMASFHQWQICSDKRLFRTLCSKCDIALNALVLRWMGFKDWRAKLTAYKKVWGIDG